MGGVTEQDKFGWRWLLVPIIGTNRQGGGKKTIFELKSLTPIKITINFFLYMVKLTLSCGGTGRNSRYHTVGELDTIGVNGCSFCYTSLEIGCVHVCSVQHEAVHLPGQPD